MAAYLVGSRGTSLHAVGLGLSVATSHTLGIVALALVIVGAQGVLPPDVVVRVTPVVAAISILAIGGWMLLNEVRRRRASRATQAPAGDHDHAHARAHAHPLDGAAHGHDHAAAPHDHGTSRARTPTTTTPPTTLTPPTTMPASTATAASATATCRRPVARCRGAACSSSAWRAA